MSYLSRMFSPKPRDRARVGIEDSGSRKCFRKLTGAEKTEPHLFWIMTNETKTEFFAYKAVIVSGTVSK